MRPLLVAILAMLAAGLAAAPTIAAPIDPTTFADDSVENGNCTLREAMQAALADAPVDACPAGSGADVIRLEAGTYTAEEVDSSGSILPEISAPEPPTQIRIQGDLEAGTTIDGAGLGTIFSSRQDGNRLVLDSLTVTGGSGERGGAIAVELTEVVVRHSTITGNEASDSGGAIYVDTGCPCEHGLHLLDSTVADNDAAEDGGGIWVGGFARFERSTIAGNTAGELGGGVYLNAGVNGDNGRAAETRASMIADNDAAQGADCFTFAGDAELDSLNRNLIESTADCAIAGMTGNDVTGVDPGLGALAANGGPTETMSIDPGSVSHDAGPPEAAPDCGGPDDGMRDQRGVDRPQGASCDIGAVEVAECGELYAGMIGGVGADVLTGGAGADGMLGLGGADEMAGLGGDDAVCGGAGTDLLDGGAGTDLLDGGAGTDTATYASSPGGVEVTLDGVANDGDPTIPENDDLISIESVIGSGGDDVLAGDAGANEFRGLAGSDRLVGENGSDRLLGAAGDDRLLGGPGNDRLSGHHGSDRLVGGKRHDALVGGPGPDTLIGGAGNDRLVGGPGRDRLVCGPGRRDVAISGRGDTVAPSCKIVR